MRSKQEIINEIIKCEKAINNTYLDDVIRFNRGKIDGLLYAFGTDINYYDYIIVGEEIKLKDDDYE